MSDLGQEIPTIYEARIGESYATGRLAGLREAAEAADVEELISIWIKRPRAGTPKGRAWEEGARQAVALRRREREPSTPSAFGRSVPEIEPAQIIGTAPLRISLPTTKKY